MASTMSTSTVPADQPRPRFYRRGPSWLLPLVVIVAIIALGLYLNNRGSDSTPVADDETEVTTPATTPATTQATTPTTLAAPATTVPTLAGAGTLPSVKDSFTQGPWKVNAYDDLGKDPIVLARLKALCAPKPSEWPTFPNVENPKSTSCPFKVANGAEYGVANVPFCQQDVRCDFVVPARHYRLITADYGFLGLTCQQGTNAQGCLLLLINVGGQTMTFRNQAADNGFSVPGRYWNGDLLEQAIQGLVSHASANMLNLPTNGLGTQVLNAGGAGDVNAGTNCGVPEGCKGVHARVVIHAGDRILAVAETSITR